MPTHPRGDNDSKAVFTPPPKRARSSNPTSETQCIHLFNAADLDRDGLLDSKDLTRIGKALETDSVAFDWPKILSQGTHSRLVSRTEFVNHLLKIWEGHVNEKTKTFNLAFSKKITKAIGCVRSVTAKQLMALIFDALDMNADGRLSRDEFFRAADALGEHIESDWEQIHRAFGSDPSRLVTKEQCIHHWTNQIKNSGALKGERFEAKYEQFLMSSLSKLKCIEFVNLAERLFDAIDRDHDGLVSKREALRASDALGFHGESGEQRWSDMLHALGKNDPEDYKIEITKQEYVGWILKHFHDQHKIRGNQGSIEYRTYIMDALERLKTLKARELCSEFFRVLDTNNDGFIEKEEVLLCHSVFSPHPKEGERLWSLMANKDDSRISKEQYVGYWMREVEGEIGANDYFHHNYARFIQSRLAKLKGKVSSMERGPLRHLVLFNLSGADEALRTNIITRFVALRSLVRGMDEFEKGIITNLHHSEPGHLSHAFLATFSGKKARDAYLPHPEHDKFVSMVSKVLDKATTVFDYVPTTLTVKANKEKDDGGGGGGGDAAGSSSATKTSAASDHKSSSSSPSEMKVWRVLMVRIIAGVDKVGKHALSFAQGCKAAAGKTGVPVSLEWGAMANHSKEIPISHKATHILLARFRTDEDAKQFANHEAWKTWLACIAKKKEQGRPSVVVLNFDVSCV